VNCFEYVLGLGSGRILTLMCMQWMDASDLGDGRRHGMKF
jgi:hypothetical protein